MVIDLESERRVVEKYLAECSVQPRRVVLVDDGLNSESLATALEKGDVLRGSPAWGCIVATEPRAHRTYVEWAVRQGMHVLLEKPVTARDLRTDGPGEALGLVADHHRLTALAEEKGVTVVVQAQRRAHPAYQLVKEILGDVVSEFGVPITYMDIHHSDGTWNMPWEFASREGHPYKYGYGKLLHSGYHFVDLFCWLTEVNQHIGRPPDRIGLDVFAVDARHVDAQLTEVSYERLFGSARWRRHSGLPRPASLPVQPWGETDVIVLARLMDGSDVLTTAVLSLLQSSFSGRSWLELPEDTYKGNGRIRHERVTIHVGPLMAIQVHSYQDGLLGGPSPFEVVVYRNRELVGGEAVTRMTMRSGAEGSVVASDSLNNRAREQIVEDFLAADGRRSGLALHRTTVRVVSAAVAGVARLAQGGSGRSVVALDASASEWYRPE
ncbi:Gfo/Idh/MocA family protein [Streptomyces aurantiacus]|uniref:Gfo/Idh/MocA family protein n=1 Tax=Streptomyces aurantiacus TaxID=47760 RepID=UPI0027D78EBF|nr:Gfo/Idh/MocA family oxidoreductase [Streptomyces aurantiacus]